MARIQLDDVCVNFDVRRHGRMTLKEFLVRGMFRRRVNPRMTVHALSHVSLDLHDGDRLGIIGHNGAGKSTLLKAMAGVYPPTTGRYERNGRVSALFDVTLGFEPDASGWENISYRGYLQGETPKSIRRQLKSIAEFSELGEHLDMAVRYYSTGMAVRLGFAIAASAEPEILIIDEILSAGDLSFQKKASARIRAMIDSARIVVLASHDLEALRGLCKQVVWMDHGQVKMLGPAGQVIDSYLAAVPQFQRAAA